MESSTYRRHWSSIRSKISTDFFRCNLRLIPIALAISAVAPACGDSENSFDLQSESVATERSALRALGFPYRYRQLDVRPSFTAEKLRRSPSNPTGIFTAAPDDGSPTSDAAAAAELIALGQGRRPSWVRYIDEGPRTKDVVLLFHGIPTYSYLWRDVIGPIAQNRRVIAFDQLGQGLSSKHTSLTYTFKQILAHTEAFIETLQLPPDSRFTVVVHDTGGAVGLAFAARHQEQVDRLVFFETILGPVPDASLLPAQAQFFLSPDGERAIIEDNAFIRDLIVNGHLTRPPNDRPFLANELSRRDKLAYALPYRRARNRRVLARWFKEIPILSEPQTGPSATNLELFNQLGEYMTTTTTPKLFMYAEPGFIVRDGAVEAIKATYNVEDSLTSVNLGRGFHFHQEDHGVRIGQEIRRWLRQQDGLPETPSADFPFRSRFKKVFGERMHYIDVGRGKPVVMLHGNPTSSYLWRNIVPFLSPKHRVIAVDLIGMGRSSKPDIDYTFEDHRRYLDQFIVQLGLRDITLVIHDWGSALGLDYAARHPDNVRGIAMMEALLPPVFPASFDTLPPFLAEFFRLARDPVAGPAFILEQNGFIEEILPSNVLRPLSERERNAYRAPYPTPDSRFPLLAWPNEVPIDGVPANVVDVVENYSAWLMASEVPKFHVYVTPGALNPPEVIDYLARRVPAYESAFVGEGIHFIQEDLPESIGLAIADWMARTVDLDD